jgi:hypothetical protein
VNYLFFFFAAFFSWRPLLTHLPSVRADARDWLKNASCTLLWLADAFEVTDFPPARHEKVSLRVTFLCR